MLKYVIPNEVIFQMEFIEKLDNPCLEVKAQHNIKDSRTKKETGFWIQIFHYL